MAGNYPDVPATRIPYDIDGTKAVHYDGTSLTDLSGTVLTSWQNDAVSDVQAGGYSPPGLNGTNKFVCLIFPKLMDLDGWYLQMWNEFNVQEYPGVVQTSTDTTNGLDGTWTTRTTGSGTTGTSPAEKMRNNIVSTTCPGTKALRIWGVSGSGYHSPTVVHLYGEPNVTTGDRLEIWHPTLDQRLTGAYFDYGNVPRGSTEDRTFRVKNLSSVYTANSVNVAFDALTDGSPSVPGQFTVSQGGSFAAQQTLSSIAPGAISPVLTVRRITPTNAQLSLWTFRIKATAASWT